ncbi:class C beta-lactamase, partial [Pseudomonas frederiksbergensis]|nr:class C beta-lactamase [Pseudomonas frederiksbergensis]
MHQKTNLRPGILAALTLSLVTGQSLADTSLASTVNAAVRPL